MTAFFLLFFSVLVLCANAQEPFIRGTVINSENADKIPFARVTIVGEKARTVTDRNGQFRLPINPASEKLQIQVKALGLDSIFVFSSPFPKSFSLSLVPKGFELETTTIRGLSAKEVVREAIKRIPQNYSSNTHLYYGSYREYQKIKDRKKDTFQNLVEANVATLIVPEVKGKKLVAQHRFLPLAIHRQDHKRLPVEAMSYIDGMTEVFNVDPVYFTKSSSLGSAVFEESTYRFDTSNGSGNYVVLYKCTISSENHGIEYWGGTIPGESYETGRIIIDRKSFAIRNINSKSFRNKWFKYELKYNRNFMPNKLHYVEFLEGELDVWYKQRGDKYFLDVLRHGFTNEFFRTGYLGYGQECVLGQFYEWKTDSLSGNLTKEMIPLFYEEPYLQFCEIPKDTLPLWKALPFYFHPKSQVYSNAGWRDE